MKKKILWIATAAMALSLIGYATYAALNAQINAQNIIRMGTVKISLLDEIGTNNAETEQTQWEAFPESVHALPGSSVMKRLTVTNVGENACYVRIKFIPQVYAGDEVIRIDDAVTLVYEGSAWSMDGDGYYRYHEILQPNESAELESNVVFDSSITNTYKDARFVIENLAQGVQSQNNEHADVLEVVGWPAA